jgi:hypothetical protein
LMVNRYADDADRRADELETEGDRAGAAIWHRVTVAIEQLTGNDGTTALIIVWFRPSAPSRLLDPSGPRPHRQ